jgi:hypothetical protein
MLRQSADAKMKEGERRGVGRANGNPEVEARSQHQRGLLLTIAVEFAFSCLNAAECANADAVRQFPAGAVRRIEASQ